MTGASLSDEGLDELVSSLLTASRVLVGVSARSIADAEDTVTLTQFRAMVVMDAHGASTLNRLADRLGVQPSTALRLVDRLIAAELAIRSENPVDRREVVLELTEQGRALVRRVTETRRRAIEDIVRGMPRENRAHIVAALIAFAQAADEPLVTADPATKLGW